MKVCFAGMGSIGKRHIKNLTMICNKDNINLEIHALRKTNTKLEDDIRIKIDKEIYDILDLDSVYDIIFITNPTYLHYNTIYQLRNHSKHFFVEKPVFENGNKDVALLKLPYDNIYYVACPLRYTNVLMRAQEVVCKERILSVRAISSSYLPDWRTGIDYRNTYSAHAEEGGGVAIDLIHEWDYLISLFGFPDEVKMLKGKLSELEIDSDDVAVYIAKYESLFIELHLDYFGKNSIREFEIITEEHRYVFDILSSVIYKDGILVEAFNEEPNDKYVRELKNFFDIVNNRKENNNDLYHAVKVLNVAIQAN